VHHKIEGQVDLISKDVPVTLGSILPAPRATLSVGDDKFREERGFKGVVKY